MKSNVLWKIEEPRDSVLAECGLRSPPILMCQPCSVCAYGNIYEDPLPLVLEWLPGSAVIGDFSWPGGGRVAVKKNVFDVIKNQCGDDVRGGAIGMVQDPRLERPKRPNRAKPRIWLPYDGPELIELISTYTVPLHDMTTQEVISRCTACGRERCQITGFQLKEHRWDSAKMVAVEYDRPRLEKQGVFLRRSDVTGHFVFRATGCPNWILCTDEFKHFIEEHGFTNIDFLEWGEIVDD